MLKRLGPASRSTGRCCMMFVRNVLKLIKMREVASYLMGRYRVDLAKPVVRGSRAGHCRPAAIRDL